MAHILHRTADFTRSLCAGRGLVKVFAQVFEEAERQNFGRYLGPLIRDAASEDDWARLAAWWRPDSDSHLFRRPGGHFVRPLTFLAGQLPA